MELLSRKGYFFIAVLMAAVLSTGCVSNTSRSQPSPDKQKMLDSRLQLAVKYIQADNRERAREHLNRALEIDSRSPEAHDLYALLYEREREFEIAEQHFKKALSSDSGFTRGRNNYGSFLLRRGRPDEACEQFRKGSSDLNYPRRAELFYKIGLCEREIGHQEKAREAFMKTVALNGRFALASLELSQMYFVEKNYQQAKQFLNHYNENRRGPSARGLWLGVQLEHIFGNVDARDSQGLALKNLFPDSGENLQYQRWLKDGYPDR